MNLLAYHPEQLAALRTALIDAIVELQATTCGILDALESDAAVRRFRRQIETELLPAVDRVLAAAPLHRGCPGVDLDRLDQSLMQVMSAGYGWQLAGDVAADDPRAVTAEEARALGARLNHTDLERLLHDPAQLDWLGLQLEIISRDPMLTREFLANFRGWARLCDAFGYARVDLTVRSDSSDSSNSADSGDSPLARIDRIVAALAATRNLELSQARECVDPARLVPQFDEMTPYAAALIVRHLSLDPHELAAVAVLILTTWELHGPSGYDDFVPGPNAADLLFGAILADPAAAAAFVVAAADHPSLLFQTAEDPTLAQRVALAGTAPGILPSTLAGDVVVTFVGWFELSVPYLPPVGLTYPAGWELFLVDLVSPWTLQLSPLNEEWDHTVGRYDTSKDELLAFVLQHDGAMHRLVANGDALLDGVVSSLERDNQRAIEELVAYLSMLSQLILDRRVSDEQAREASWSLMLDVVGMVATVATIPASPATGLAVDAAVIGGAALLGDWQPDPDHVRAVEQLRHEHRQAGVGSLLATRCVQLLVSQGRLPANVPPSPTVAPDAADPVTDFRKRFNRWLDELRAAGFDDEAAIVDDVVSDAVNASMAGEDAAG